MSIWNKILIGFIAVGSLVFFYLAMRTLKTQEHWRNMADACEYFLAKDKECSIVLSEGGQELLTLDDNDAVRQLREFYKKYNYAGFNVTGETKWPDFKKAVLEAVSKTGKLDRNLLAACKFKTEETLGLGHWRMVLKKATLNRSRIWDNFVSQEVTVAKAEKTEKGTDRDKVVVKVTDAQPEAQGIVPKMLVYVFDRRKEETDTGVDYISYLGEFAVESVGTEDRPNVIGEKQAVVQLSPTKALTPQELETLKASHAECGGKKTRVWVLYERLPLDENGLFANRTDEEKEKLLRTDSVKEYVKDGQPATWEDMEAWGVTGELVDAAGLPLVDEQGNKKAGEKGFYRRTLRDYQALFGWYDNQRIIMNDLLATIKHDAEQLTTAAAEAKQDVDLCKQEVAALTAESNRLQVERKLAVAHFKAVEQRLGEFLKGFKKPDGSWQKGLVDLLKDNEELSKEVSRQQFEAVRRIDERTRTMASAGEGR
jgi:hypothetical protein